MRIIVAKDYSMMSKIASRMIETEIKKNPRAILGLATGSTPVGAYKKLIDAYKKGLDFSKVTVFNLDEYYGLAPSHEQSYAYFMRENLFNHINIDISKTYIPDGMTKNPKIECRKYDQLVRESGGIDLQLLGIGENGHIGFNEPSEELQIDTHLVELTHTTVSANSRFFESVDDVPRQAITMGLGSIMKADKIILLASGENKSKIIAKTIEGKVSTSTPSSLLQLHPKVTLIIDQEISNYLKIKNLWRENIQDKDVYHTSIGF
ncbi:glucosamine-6-phosphate deaminase [Sporosalibacterium faouarense]|uniref:glucosamine-6-phosphate deaminase n=1 Tax=Sporosalibacterium faouarense TaxID=516123 RepID=UPI00141D6260|nr:glucosamine-6-phosphate deaminase [Sporosalibacterium faouarense]MTI47116.1 glucosamine-6-phosphate deaminase [Bacillota bacterium]